jgi:23S rRNA-/tRNA-specific pseudouridylate synthase
MLAKDNSGLIALEKPAGILAHPNTPKTSPRALLNAPYDADEEAYIWEGKKLYLLHRLDSPTSGVILLALNPKIAAHVREAFEASTVKKTYQALVHGTPLPQPKLWADHLATQRQDSGLRTHKRPGHGLLSKTIQQLIQQNRKLDISLLKLMPLTGRTHQLRVQCQLHHVPIVGDKTYGNFSKNRIFERLTGEKRLFLHAACVQVPLPTGAEFFAEAPLPASFLTALSAKP